MTSDCGHTHTQAHTRTHTRAHTLTHTHTHLTFAQVLLKLHNLDVILTVIVESFVVRCELGHDVGTVLEGGNPKRLRCVKAGLSKCPKTKKDGFGL